MGHDWSKRFESYYSNGQIQEIINHNQGVLHGHTLYFYINGNLKTDDLYNNGRRVYHKKYNKNKQMIKHTVYRENSQCNQKLCAEYENELIKYYHIKILGVWYVIYSHDASSSQYTCVVNRIITSQRRFRRKLFFKPIYQTIFYELNSVIGINVLSLIVLSYIKN